MIWRNALSLLLTPVLAAVVVMGGLCAVTWATDPVNDIVAAVPRDFPPHHFTDDSGVVSGFGVDIMNQVAAIAGLKIRYEVYDTWSEVFKAVTENRADIIPNIGVTSRRSEFLDFTPTVETVPIRIFVRRGTVEIHSLTDLAGYSVGVMKTNIGYKIASGQEYVDMVLADSLPDLLFKLLSGHVDAIIYPAPVIEHAARSMSVADRIKAVGPPLMEIKRAIGVRKGCPELLVRLSEAVDTFMGSSEYKQTYVKWYGTPAPFWTQPIVAATMGGVAFSFFILAGIWRYGVLKRTNAVLARTMAERSRAEKALAENEQTFRTVVESFNEGIWRTDAEGYTTYVNTPMYEMLGYEEGEMIGRHLYEFMDDEGVRLYHRYMDSRQERGTVQRDFKFLTAAGVLLPTRIAISQQYDGSGKYAGLLAGVIDISFRVNAYEELRKSRERLAEAQSVAKMGSWECEIDTGELYWSDELYNIFDKNPQTFHPSYDAFFNLIHPEDRAKVGGAVIHTLENNEPYSLDHRIMLSDGSVRIIHEQGHLVHNEEIGAVRLLGTAQDVTDRKQIEIALRKARDDAENANRIKDEFLANISHELRTPLNGVLGMLHLLRDSALNDEQMELADIAVNSGRHLVTLLSDILDISSIEAGAVALDSTDFQLREILDTIHDVFKDAAAEKFIALSIDAAPEVPNHLEGDGSRLRQVLFNLVGNAVKFTASGQVTLGVGLSPNREDDQIRLLFEISDTGIGIPDEMVGLIFDPFTQVDGSHTRRYGGMGLGLSIVKKLVGLMGGNISIDTEKGTGTTICFTALFGTPAPAVVAPCAVDACPPMPSRRILLAEDDRVNRITATRFLEKLGHQVVAVENGWLAVEAILNGNFDLVLMDIQMPEMNGFEATAAIRRNAGLGEKANVPIIALTAHAMEKDRNKCFFAGMTDYIAKPVELSTLAEMLAKHLNTDA